MELGDQPCCSQKNKHSFDESCQQTSNFEAMPTSEPPETRGTVWSLLGSMPESRKHDEPPEQLSSTLAVLTKLLHEYDLSMLQPVECLFSGEPIRVLLQS